VSRWLLKTEPSDYSFARLQKEKRTTWSGVKNAQALIHLRGVKKGDEIFIYHTGDEKSVVGVARAAGDAKGGVVDVTAVRALAKPVTLAAIKADSRFKDFALVRISRLSVMPVTDAQWKAILKLACG
jgi:predicted RNA-binding protein with PUA-like domain